MASVLFSCISLREYQTTAWLVISAFVTEPLGGVRRLWLTIRNVGRNLADGVNEEPGNRLDGNIAVDSKFQVLFTSPCRDHQRCLSPVASCDHPTSEFPDRLGRLQKSDENGGVGAHGNHGIEYSSADGWNDLHEASADQLVDTILGHGDEDA
jgi:hypothetical protein